MHKHQAVEPDSDHVEKEQIFTTLSNQRRRWVLHFLQHHEEDRVQLRTLVDVLSEWEYERPADELSWKERKRVYTALRQSHLPKLASSGAIEYDRTRGEVELTDDAREFQLYLEYTPVDDVHWNQWYLWLTGIAAVIVGLAWLSVPPFANLSGMALATVLLGMFSTIAIVHTYTTRRNRIAASGGPP
ncbi:hypothetical protein B1756_11590 [Natrarchaeobaculum aegyptiacum]|uniref:DUF7344 domain-containing protein n=1 Tax=Natrarchaeobaculum aegyptiacum TaxID=745377 RepID=A0A2Z2HWS5_9EURY|nr:hypothetical protein B1756_11590 [Natrarchaeobaculum aegyptiacum]